MTTGSWAAAAGRPLALAGLLALVACSNRSRATDRHGPVLSVIAREGAVAARRPVEPAIVSLALAGLPAGELARLREHLRESTDTALRRAAPDVFDLGEAPDAASPDPLRLALPDVPALTAAANVLGSPWEAPGISVRLGPTCAAEATRCIPLLEPPGMQDDALTRRGRALAWALGNAIWLQVSATSRPALIRALQESRTRPQSTIAMVFGAARGSLDEAELDGLRRQARESLEQVAAGSSRRPWLEALAAAPASWELPVPLESDQVLVIPRLAALARLQDFAAEVHAAMTAGGSPRVPAP